MAAKSLFWTRLGRMVLAVCLLALVGLGVPRAVQAAASTHPAAYAHAGFISIIAVQKNTEATVSAQGFPAHTAFKVRVGPYYTFFSQAVNMGWIDSGEGGDFHFNIMLPDAVKDVALVTVRLDSANSLVAFNAFNNVDSGTIDDSTSVVTLTPVETPSQTSTPAVVTTTPAAIVSTPIPVTGATSAAPVYIAPTKTPAPVWTAYGCRVISAEPAVAVPTNWDFDAVWVVENTGYWTWDQHAVDIGYYSGDHTDKSGRQNDIPASVKMGEQVTLRGDMLAPGKSGTYHTVWSVHADRGPICLLPLTLVVK